MEKLKIENISLSFNEKEVLKNISLDLFPHKIYALSGVSGVGKSTLANIIAGHLHPTSGLVFLDNQKINSPRRDIFIVHQNDDLFPWLTTYEQLNFVKKLTHSEINLDKILTLFKLENIKDLYPHQLSGGMKKRLALIRAEILSPEILILDETFSSLDQSTLNDILSEMIPIWKKRSMIVIIITHQIDSIRPFVDEILSI